MPLHDWTDRPGWEGVHLFWITELARWLNPRLPTGYRAYVGSAPLLAVGGPQRKADVSVMDAPQSTENLTTQGDASGADEEIEPDVEVAVGLLESEPAVLVERAHRLVAAIELVSPRNKDRASARSAYGARYLGYLLDGINLLLVDVMPRPRGFSFADLIAREFGMELNSLPTPHAVAYRVGDPAATGGRLVGLWQRQLVNGAPLPKLPLPLAVGVSVPVDLEATYTAAAHDALVD